MWFEILAVKIGYLKDSKENLRCHKVKSKLNPKGLHPYSWKLNYRVKKYWEVLQRWDW